MYTEHAKGLAWAQWYIYSQVYEAPILDHPSFCMNNKVIFKRKLYFSWSQQAAFPWLVEPAGSSFPPPPDQDGTSCKALCCQLLHSYTELAIKLIAFNIEQAKWIGLFY